MTQAQYDSLMSGKTIENDVECFIIDTAYKISTLKYPKIEVENELIKFYVLNQKLSTEDNPVYLLAGACPLSSCHALIFKIDPLKSNIQNHINHILGTGYIG